MEKYSMVDALRAQQLGGDGVVSDAGHTYNGMAALTFTDAYVQSYERMKEKPVTVVQRYLDIYDDDRVSICELFNVRKHAKMGAARQVIAEFGREYTRLSEHYNMHRL